MDQSSNIKWYPNSRSGILVLLAALYLWSQYWTSAWEISSSVLKKKDSSGSLDHLQSKCIRNYLQKLKKIVPVHQLEYQFSELYSAHSRCIDSILDTVPTFLFRWLCSDAATGKISSEKFSSAWTGTQHKPWIKGQGTYEVQSNSHIPLCPPPLSNSYKKQWEKLPTVFISLS